MTTTNGNGAPPELVGDEATPSLVHPLLAIYPGEPTGELDALRELTPLELQALTLVELRALRAEIHELVGGIAAFGQAGLTGMLGGLFGKK